MDPLAIIAAVVGVLGGLAGAYSTVRSLRWRGRKVVRSDLVEAREARGQAEEERRQAVEELRALRPRVRELEDRDEQCRREVEALRGEVQRITQDLPTLLLWGKLDAAPPDLYTVLEELSRGAVPVVITPADRGRFRWVSGGFAELLGRTPEELLERDWRSLVHPDDIAATEAAEAAAWDQPIRFVNRWRRPDGSYARLRWYATSYQQGVCLAAVRLTARQDPPLEEPPP